MRLVAMAYDCKHERNIAELPGESAMATNRNLLFSWAAVDQLPDLERRRMILEARRGRCRNDDPVRAMWRAAVVCQHLSVEARVRKLQRNPALLQLCGFDPLGRQGRCRRPAGGFQRGAVRAAAQRGAVGVQLLPVPAGGVGGPCPRPRVPVHAGLPRGMAHAPGPGPDPVRGR